MSGGTFDYGQYRFAEWIDKAIEEADTRKEDGSHLYSKATRKKIGECIRNLRKAQIQMHRMDYLFAGDDGEDTFHARLEQELKEMK